MKYDSTMVDMLFRVRFFKTTPRTWSTNNRLSSDFVLCSYIFLIWLSFLFFWFFFKNCEIRMIIICVAKSLGFLESLFRRIYLILLNRFSDSSFLSYSWIVLAYLGVRVWYWLVFSSGFKMLVFGFRIRFMLSFLWCLIRPNVVFDKILVLVFCIIMQKPIYIFIRHWLLSKPEQTLFEVWTVHYYLNELMSIWKCWGTHIPFKVRILSIAL